MRPPNYLIEPKLEFELGYYSAQPHTKKDIVSILNIMKLTQKKLANIVTSVPPIIIHYINESELDMGTGPIYNLHERHM